jgi:hypothetical protein
VVPVSFATAQPAFTAGVVCTGGSEGPPSSNKRRQVAVGMAVQAGAAVQVGEAEAPAGAGMGAQLGVWPGSSGTSGEQGQQVSGGGGTSSTTGAWSHEYECQTPILAAGQESSCAGPCTSDPLLSGLYASLSLPLNATTAQIREWLSKGRSLI